MISDDVRKKVEQMRGHFNAGLNIAKELNARPDAIQLLHTAIGGVTSLADYDNNVKPSQG